MAAQGARTWGGLTISSASVLSVNVSSNHSLTYLALNCAALTSLMASQCYRLEQLQEGFTCPNLKFANLAGCKALQGNYLLLLSQKLTCECLRVAVLGWHLSEFMHLHHATCMRTFRGAEA